MVLFYHPTGPKVEYADGTLRLSDLNPEKEMTWRMSRGEMLRLGWNCIKAALTRSTVM